MPDTLVSVSAALFCAVGSGWLGCALGAFVWRRSDPGFGPPTKAIVVLIPAHQEEQTLPGTIASIRVAAARASCPVRIVVGADSCSDGTEAIARAAGAEVVPVSFQSKWKTLAAIASSARNGEWVALVDAGALWPKDLLTDLAEYFRDENLLGVAPAYFPANASWSEKFFWRIESACKVAENRAGGPVSVHGATVFYRFEALHAAYGILSRYRRQSWLNDDVALPLAARIAFPGGALRYWRPEETGRRVSDAGLNEKTPQFRRRFRMVAGNLEWVTSLFFSAIVYSPAAALVALRRILRVFWAYWALILVYSFCFAFFPKRDAALLATAVTGTASSVGLLMFGKRSLLEAAIASFAAPLCILSVLRRRAQVWN